MMVSYIDRTRDVTAGVLNDSGGVSVQYLRSMSPGSVPQNLRCRLNSQGQSAMGVASGGVR